MNKQMVTHKIVLLDLPDDYFYLFVTQAADHLSRCYPVHHMNTKLYAWAKANHHIHLTEYAHVIGETTTRRELWDLIQQYTEERGKDKCLNEPHIWRTPEAVAQFNFAENNEEWRTYSQRYHMMLTDFFREQFGCKNKEEAYAKGYNITTYRKEWEQFKARHGYNNRAEKIKK